MRGIPTVDVCAAVVSHLPFDARVWKEAGSLSAAGYSVALYGCRYELPRPRRTRQNGIEVLEVPFGARSGRTDYLARVQALFGLWVAIIRTRARVYHAHNIHVGLPAWAASRLRRAALIYDAHELYGEVRGGKVRARLVARCGMLLERFLVRRSDGVVTTNESRADVLRERHGRRSIEILANVPRRIERVEPVDPGYPDGTPILLYQGGVYPHARAFKETLQALAHLDGVNFAIIGFGRDTDIELVRQWAAEAGVLDRVHLLPPRPFDQLVRTAASATVGLVPVRPDNLNHLLGDTNKLHEYMMAGLPIVGSDIPEVRRVVTAGDPPVGELFDAASPESIAAAVRQVLADPERYELRRREARRLALERYNWEMEERRLLALYAKLLSVSPP